MCKNRLSEIRLADLLADPILWMMMKADRIDEVDLMRVITAAARRGTERTDSLCDPVSSRRRDHPAEGTIKS